VRKRVIICAVVAAAFAALALPAVATADDQAVWTTYNHSHGKALSRATDAYVKAYKRMIKTHFQKPRWIRASLKASKGLLPLVRAITADVRAQQPSSDGGKEGKALLMKALNAWKTAQTLDVRALRADLEGRHRRAIRIAKRSTAAFARSDRYEKKAIKELRAAGVDAKAKARLR
jgi:hypothetical protein